MAKFKGFIKHCEVCGTEFRVPKSLAHVRTCSTECGYKIRKVGNKVDPVKWECKHCRKPMFDPPSLAAQRVYCSQKCKFSDPELIKKRSQNFASDRNPGWQGGISVKSVSATGKTYRRSQAHKETERNVRRKRVIEGATPPWATHEKVLGIYEQARKISELTGVQHHVDHVVPLTSSKVCGLHNEFNLRVIPATDNLKKHNRTWPDMW
jgi:hypothetical protein